MRPSKAPRRFPRRSPTLYWLLVQNTVAYAIGIPALISVELRGLTRYVGIVTGVVGVAAVVGVGVLVIVVSVLTTLWVVLVGVRLLRNR